MDAEIHLHIQKASVAYGKLEKRVCSDRKISLKTKFSVYKSCILSTLCIRLGLEQRIIGI